MTSRKHIFLLAFLLPVLATAQTIHYDSGYTWRAYTGTVAPTCPSKLCHYFQMTSADPYYTEFAAWKSTTDNPNTASAFVNFRVVFPRGYNVHDTTKTWPLIVLFHGAGESGRVWTNHYNYVPTDSTYDNNSHQLKHGGHQHRLAAGKVPTNTGSFPGIVIFPQASYSGVWGDSTTTNLSEQEKILVGFIEDHLVKKYHVDINRVVAHGLSNGGRSLWALAQKRPDLFAAILPMSAVPLNPNQASTILVTTPIRLFQGGLDKNPTPGAAQQTINAFIAKGGTPEYFLYEDLGHGTWNRAYNEPDFFLWIRARDKRQIHVFGGTTQLCDNSIKLGFSANMLTYQWTRDGVDIPGATGRYLENIAQPGNYRVRFQRPSGGWDESFAVNITQNSNCNIARPVLSANLNTTACSQVHSSITLDDDGGAVSAATFNITAINFNGLTASAGAPSIGNGFYNVEIFDDAYINKGTAPVNVVYTVVPVSSGGIAGDAANVVLTVNPEPVLKASLGLTRCSDIASGIILDDSGTSANAATFDITSINFNGLIASAGSPAVGTSLPATAVSDDAYTNVALTSKNVIYSITPKSSAGCQGQSTDVILGVEPEPVMSSALDATVGSEQPSGIILDDDGTGIAAASFNITHINFNSLTPSAGSPAIGNALPANVIGDDAFTNSGQSSVSVTYSVQPVSAGACLGNVASVVLTVSPVPVVGGEMNVTRCSDVASGIVLSDDGSGVQAATFDITSINIDGLTASAGNPATGTGLNAQVISDDAYTNKTGAAKNVVYTIVPVSSSGHRGKSAAVTLTVNPEPVLKSIALEKCSRIASGIVLDDNGTGVNAASFNITAINFNGLTPAAGVPATGSELPATAISDDAYINTGTTNVQVSYSIVPVSSNACPGDVGTTTLTVHPEPVLSSTISASVESDAASGIILDDNGSSAYATAFQITSINTNGLTASAGAPATGDNLSASVISDDAFTNATEQAVNVVYSVIPISQQACRGIAGTVTLTVEPKPVEDTDPGPGEDVNVTLCSDAASDVILSDSGSGVQAATFDITGIIFNGLTPSAGNPSVGTGLNAAVISDDAYTNKTAAAKNVIYTVVPVSSTGSRGKTSTITLTVNPEPVLKALTMEKCSRIPSGLLLDDNGTGVNAASFNITAINFNGLTPSSGTPATGTGLPATAISDDAYLNTGLTSVQVVYTVIPVSSNVCPGDAFAVPFTIHPEPVLASPINTTVGSDTPSGIILDDNGSSANATAFQITSINLNGLTASAGAPATGDNLPAAVISDDAFTNSTELAVNVVYSVIPISQQTCRGTVGTVTLTIGPGTDDDTGEDDGEDDGEGDGGDDDQDTTDVVEVVTALKDLQNNEQVVFPNPTSGTVTIRSGTNDWPGAVMVISATGQAILMQTTRGIDGSIELDLSSLTRGLYILRSGSFVAKVVKE